MNLCKLAMLVAVMALISVPRIHADEVIPFHGKIDSDGTENLRLAVFAKLLKIAIGTEDVHVDGSGHYHDLNPMYFYNHVGKLFGTFQLGTCGGASMESLMNTIASATRHEDFFAAKAYAGDLLRRTQCEAAHSGECKFSYELLNEDRLRISLLPDSCAGLGVKGMKFKAVSVEIYRVDGNNAAISDVTGELERRP